MKTVNRTDHVQLPPDADLAISEFQEREIFDLFGIVFTGHPDLRRLLMWTSSRTPMRRITWSRTILNMSRQRTTKC